MSDGATPIPEFAIARLELKPGDILVAKSSEHLSREFADRISEWIKLAAPDHMVLVLDARLDLSVLTKAELAELQEQAA